MPLIQEVKILSYNKETNTCTGTNQYGEIFGVDPFVGCAIRMTDEEYEAGNGFDVVGKTYLMTQYSVYRCGVAPHEYGFLEVQESM